jgi:hypothetical protein
MKNASGLATGNLSPGTPNESTLELATLSPVNSTIVEDIGELEVSKESDNWQTLVQAVDQKVDHQMCVIVEEKEDDPVITKKTNITNIPSKTRQSARIQDANDHTLKKAIAQKANAKGITSSSRIFWLEFVVSLLGMMNQPKMQTCPSAFSAPRSWYPTSHLGTRVLLRVSSFDAPSLAMACVLEVDHLSSLLFPFHPLLVLVKL